MLSALFKRKAGRSERGNSATKIPYQIECACGHLLTGTRSREAVTIRCPKCKAANLVFPSSPLTDLRETIRDGLRNAAEASKPSAPSGSMIWRKPLVAAGAALTVIVVVFLVLLKSSLFRDAPAYLPADDESTAEAIAAGRQAIADLDYRKAAEHFRYAQVIARKKSRDKGEAEVRWLWQMEQEAAIMADLLDLSLEEVLQKAGGLGDRTWKDQFARRYVDRTIIFDAVVRDIGSGSYRIDYPTMVAGVPVRIEVHQSATLRDLKVQWPARMLVGIRLGEARRERGSWLVVAKPESVVLFTEPAFFQGSSVPIDAGLVEQLKKQAAWLNVTPP